MILIIIDICFTIYLLNNIYNKFKNVLLTKLKLKNYTILCNYKFSVNYCIIFYIFNLLLIIINNGKIYFIIINMLCDINNWLR